MIWQKPCNSILGSDHLIIRVFVYQIKYFFSGINIIFYFFSYVPLSKYFFSPGEGLKIFFLLQQISNYFFSLIYAQDCILLNINIVFYIKILYHIIIIIIKHNLYYIYLSPLVNRPHIWRAKSPLLCQCRF